jgi:phosphatidylglycerol:prolipoprotein diacylglycerol transferase
VTVGEGFAQLLERGFHAGYVVPVLAGLLLAALFPASRGIADPVERSKYRWLQALTLIGALLGAKFAAIVGDLRWPIEPVGPEAFFAVGRSITGGLLFGFLTAELLKPLFAYHTPPNDRFAMILPFSIAIGRVGCLLVGCCNGRPTDAWLALPDEDGVMRHPTALYDLVFHLALGAAFVVMQGRGVLRHRLFALHLVLYGGFRFAIEPLRDSRPYLLSLSAYQIFALAMLGCGLWGFLRRLPPTNRSEEPLREPAVAASGPAAPV